MNISNQTLIYIFGFLVFCGLIWFIGWMWIKIKMRKIKKSIPSNVIEELNEAERRYRLYDGRKSQQDILFELASEHFRNSKSTTPRRVEEFETRQSSDQRADVSIGDADSYGSSVKQISRPREPEQSTGSSDKPNRFNPIKF